MKYFSIPHLELAIQVEEAWKQGVSNRGKIHATS